MAEAHRTIPESHAITVHKTQPKSIVFAGRKHRIEQVAYEACDYVVYELRHEIELAGTKEKYIAVTDQAQLFSIDIYATPKEFLTTHHGQVWMEIS